MRDHPKMFKVAYEDLEIGQVIGKGSTGAVLEAVHKPTGTRLALKVCVCMDVCIYVFIWKYTYYYIFFYHIS